MKKSTSILMVGAMLSVSVLLVNCTKTNTVTDTVTKTNTVNPYAGTIFSNEGSFAGIDSLNTHFVANVVADNNINSVFVAAFNGSTNNEYNFVTSLYNFLVTATGGPNIYNGPGASQGLAVSMMEVHHGMNITQAQFNSLAGDLANAIHTCKWAVADSTGLMGAAASLSPDVVGQ
jgi:truncated hemoglobin YjbI